MDHKKQQPPFSAGLLSTQHKETESLSKQYGGSHSNSWVNHLPSALIPFVQLSRLSPPSALLLIYIPHLLGALHAANIHRKLAPEVLHTATLLLGGSFFFSNAAHAWNDLVDAPLDKLIPRTKNRPIANGTITARQALIFTATQAVLAASFLLWLPPPTAVATLPTIFATTYYPWAKKHTYFPQVVLGCCIGWGSIVGCAAAGASCPWLDMAPLCLFLACALWVVIYDTICRVQVIEIMQ